MNTTQGFRGCDLNLTEHDGDAIISLGTDDFDEADIGKLRKRKTSAWCTYSQSVVELVTALASADCWWQDILKTFFRDYHPIGDARVMVSTVFRQA